MFAILLACLKAAVSKGDVAPIYLNQGRAFIRKGERWVEATDSVAYDALGARRVPCKNTGKVASAIFFGDYRFFMVGGMPPTTTGVQCSKCGYYATGSAAGKRVHPKVTMLVAPRRHGIARMISLKN